MAILRRSSKAGNCDKSPGTWLSPEVKQTIASWVQQVGWTKPPVVENKAAPLTQTAPELVAPKAPAAPSLNQQQVHQIETDIAAVQQAVERQLAEVRASVERLTATQDHMVGEITKLQVADEEILAKIPVPPPPRAVPGRKRTPMAPPSRPQPRH